MGFTWIHSSSEKRFFFFKKSERCEKSGEFLRRDSKWGTKRRNHCGGKTVFDYVNSENLKEKAEEKRSGIV